jgi:O-antigen ligase
VSGELQKHFSFPDFDSLSHWKGQNMWSKAKIAYWAGYILMFFVLSCSFSILSLQTPEQRSGPFSLVCTISAAIYAVCLVLTRSRTGFWKGMCIFVLILTTTQAVGFFVYLVKTNEIKYGIGESADWYTTLELIPSLIIAAVWYPLAYCITRLLSRMARH